MIPLLFTGLALFGFLFFSVFRRHALINFICILLAMGMAYLYETSGYAGSFWFDSALAVLIIYEIKQVGENKKT